MTKYIVKKEFVYIDNEFYDKDRQFIPKGEGHEYDEYLKEWGFIEEVKEDTRWRNVKNAIYWLINEDGLTVPVEDRYHSYNNSSYEYGNYFKSEETAEKVAEALKLFFEYLHTVPGTPQQNIKNQFEQAHAKARKAVLQDDKAGSDE